MKKYLIPQGGQFFKANLHAHTTYSDGRLTPEETKKYYKEKGYSVFAFTDHDVFIPHDDLKDEGFLPLHGYEVEITEEGPQSFDFKKCCHLCFIALDPDIKQPVCLHRDWYTFANAVKYKDQMDLGNQPNYVRHYTPECINDMIKKGREAGFFVSYNHPTWSLEDYRDYSKYEGMNALEIFNGSCFVEAYDDRNGRVYDDMLRLGKKIAVTGSDDNHDACPIGDVKNDSFVAWTMIKADSLDYKAIGKALANGDYYASMGPEIKELYIEDGVLKVECSEAKRISFVTGIRRTCSIIDKDGKLTHGEFSLRDCDKYVRVIVMDKDGMTAESRAYFTDELGF